MESEEIQKLSVAALLKNLEASCKSLVLLDNGMKELRAEYEDLKAEAYRRMMS